MAYAAVSKTVGGNPVWVRLPPSALLFQQSTNQIQLELLKGRRLRLFSDREIIAGNGFSDTLILF